MPKGPAVCEGIPGIKEIDAATSILSGLKHGLMQDAAYEEFRRNFMVRMRDTEATSGAALKILDTAIRELEKSQGNLVQAVETGLITDSIRVRLKTVEAELIAARVKREDLVPEPLTLPEDLPAFYRAFVENLTGTLTNVEVAGRAGDELLNAVVVSWDADLGAHRLEIRGKLLEMLQKAKPALGAGLLSNDGSLNLAAGGRYRRNLPELRCCI